MAGNQRLVNTEAGSLTVSQTLAGVSERRAELADQPQPAQLREIATQIDAAKHRQHALRDFAAKLEQHQQQQDRVDQAKGEALVAAEQAEQASDAARASREANRAVGAAQEALTKAHGELATVQQQIGSAGVASRRMPGRTFEMLSQNSGLMRPN